MIWALASVLGITFLVWILNRFLPFKICPICAGVSLTWVAVTMGILQGVLSSSEYLIPLAFLMGGTVVGIAFQGERRFAWAGVSIWRWKVPVVVFGLGLTYWLFVEMSWTSLIMEGAILVFLVYLFFVQPHLIVRRTESMHENPEEVERLTKEMEQCC